LKVFLCGGAARQLFGAPRPAVTAALHTRAIAYKSCGFKWEIGKHLQPIVE
jgi:hypothetical protein